jgi:hypothetical protein
MGWVGNVACMGEMRNGYKIFVEKSEGKRPLRRRRRRWEDNIKMDLKEIEWRGVGWMNLDQDRDQWRDHLNTVMNLPVPQEAGNLTAQ